MRALSYLCLAFGLLAPLCTAAEKGSFSSIAQRDDKKERVVFPKDGKYEDALRKTEDHIKNITKTKDPIYSYRNRFKALSHWLVNATDSQQKLIREDEGVLDVEENIEVFTPHAAFPKPSPKAKLFDTTPNKTRRAPIYTSQTKAASELVMVSQPT
jgi:hypothetical protein